MAKARWADRGGDERSAMRQASDALPFRPYVYGGEPSWAVTRGEESAPDIAPGPEWYRERAAEDDDELAELVASRDRYQDAQAVLNAPPAPVPAAPQRPAARCRQCGYLTTAVGHKVACDG